MLTHAALSVFALLLNDLPLVDRGDPAHFQQNVRAIVKSLDQLGAPLPADTRAALQAQLEKPHLTPTDMIEMQELLDAQCLIGVTINPESRVKAVRGQADAVLRVGKRSVFLVKVLNDAGVTQGLALTGPQLAKPGATTEERWLRAEFHRKPPLAEKLGGREVEYLILICEGTSAGKREAKLSFDVGQGTQDLGFLAEVPVLFTIKASK